MRRHSLFVCLLLSLVYKQARPLLGKPVVIEWRLGMTEEMASLKVPIGTSVTWIWMDSLAHSIQDMDFKRNNFGGVGGGNNTVLAPFSYNFTFMKQGFFAYKCGEFGLRMRGVIKVQGHPLVPRYKRIQEKMLKTSSSSSDSPAPHQKFSIFWYLGVTNKQASLTVPVGSTVSWIWSDTLHHSVEDLDFERDLFEGPGGANNFEKAPFIYNYTFTKVGIYRFDCAVHDLKMAGSVVVARENPSPSGHPAKVVEIPWEADIFISGHLFVDINVGDTVVWVWKDYYAHGIRGIGSAAGYFTGKGSQYQIVYEKGFKYNHTFNKPGSYPFGCIVHDFMFGTITVSSGVAPPPQSIVPPPPSSGEKFNIPWFFGVTASQASLTVSVGSTVSWLWSDASFHSIQDLNSTRNKFEGQGGGDNFATAPFIYNYTFNEPGQFVYICGVHGSFMSGTISVTKRGAPPRPALPPAPPPGNGEYIISWYLGVTKEQASLTVPVGHTVSWVWADNLHHSIEDLDFERDLFEGKGGGNNFVKAPFMYNFTFTKVGIYEFDCAVHDLKMTGVITVVGDAPHMKPPQLKWKANKN